MQRVIEKELIIWKNKKNRKPLILQGARQVGKTFSIKAFGNKYFDNIHYFDLEESKVELESIFNNSSLDPLEIINKLSFISSKNINIKNDLLILDEIQAIPRAITSLKYFQQNLCELAVISAGSNLGVRTSSESFPVGKVECITMYPMNFEEYLLGINEKKSYEFLKNFNGKKTDDIYHNKLFSILKSYFIVGGLPEIVNEYQNLKANQLEAFKSCRKLQNQLLIQYQSDFSKHAGSTNSRHIDRIFKSVPYQLSAMQEKNANKYKFKDVISNGYRKYEDLADPIEWLIKAGLILKVNNNEHPSTPLLAGIKENNFKLLLFDIGLLGAMNNLSPESIMQYNYGSYKGYFAENFVLQELTSYNFSSIVTWAGKSSEIEFLTEIENSIIPIEVKAGVNTKAKSLLAYINKYNPKYSIKFSGNKYGYDEKRLVYNYPLYMVGGFARLSN